MNRKDLIHKIQKQLEIELQRVERVASQAQLESTDSEMIQKSKYETQGIEASYLAQAHQKRLADLKDEILRLKAFDLDSVDTSERVTLGSIVTVENEDGVRERFFLLPSVGKVEVEGVKLISVQSPMGNELMGLEINDSFEVKVGSELIEYTVVQIE